MKPLKSLVRDAELGDARRNERCFQLIAAMVAGRAVAATEHANWNHAMAAYRFFNNEQVRLDALYGIAHEALRQRIEPGARVYIAHDPSLVDLSHHRRKSDRVKIGNHYGLGYELFTSLVLDSSGRPLGPVFQEVRTAEGCYSSEPVPADRNKTTDYVGAIEQMEKGVAAARRHLAHATRVHLADREFDDLQLERWMMVSEREAPEPFVVRAQHLSRRVLYDGAHVSLQQIVSTTPLRRGGTVVHNGVRYRRFVGECSVVFDGVSRRGRHRGDPPRVGVPIVMRVVIAELRAKGQETIPWVLLTNLTDPARMVVEAYEQRWQVERYFYLVKSGFKLEQWTQQSGERFARRLAVMSLAAMVLHQLLALDDEQSQQTVRFIATQGGWLGRKSDPLGPLVLMRGMMRILDALATMEQLTHRELKATAEMILPGIHEQFVKQRRRHDV